LKLKRLAGLLLIIAATLSGCYKPGPGAKEWQVSGLTDSERYWIATATPETLQPTSHTPDDPILTPTPNTPVTLPTLRADTVQYTVKYGDTLAKIAHQFQVTVPRLIEENGVSNANQIEIGQVLVVPPPVFAATASDFKIIPDSELINSPSNAGFDVDAFVQAKGGYLATYSEEVDGVPLSGSQILARVALQYSVNPRLLLTVLEYRSGWVTESQPVEETLDYPMLVDVSWLKGLYLQLNYAADLLNRGYYLWEINAISAWILSDNSVVQVDPTINAGTAGVLNLLCEFTTIGTWAEATSENGIYAVYAGFFGYPFDYAFEPMIPENLTQPEMQLPFEVGDVWSYTSGPHGGWDSGSAWAALDFAPPGEALGCFPSNTWVVASASGQIVYSQDGAVIQDLDGDGIWQTGWSILYMHVAGAERVSVGTYLEAGDRVGHASCEGGYSTGTHLHIARRYNGEWIAADGDLPFVMDGWVSSGYGVEYDGYLTKGDWTVEAWNGRSSINAIQR
jgi:murein DD-endopeptidase MepM/ murein hydrolase activator NlpD